MSNIAYMQCSHKCCVHNVLLVFRLNRLYSVYPLIFINTIEKFIIWSTYDKNPNQYPSGKGSDYIKLLKITESSRSIGKCRNRLFCPAVFRVSRYRE